MIFFHQLQNYETYCNDIIVTWMKLVLLCNSPFSKQPPEEQEQNGELLGYKIFFRSEKDPEGTEEIEVVGAGTTSYELLYLDMYTRYIITILCFNPAGDGPKSDPVYVRTLQDLPGPVANLSFTDITMNSLKVVWDSPARPNGEIVGYLVTYVTARPDESEFFASFWCLLLTIF